MARRVGDQPWFALALVLHPVETLYSARFRQDEADLTHAHAPLWMAVKLRAARPEVRLSVAGTNAGAAWRTLLLAALPTVLAGGDMPTRQGLQLL